MESRRTNPDSEDNIKRIDSKPRPKGQKRGESHGFQVYFKRDGVEYTRFFSDSTNGNKEGARAAARAFRPELEASIPASKAGLPAFSSKARSNTGRMGISITSAPRAVGPAQYVTVSVRVAKGETKNKKLLVGDRSLKAVIKEAVAWRDSLLAERASLEAQPGARRQAAQPEK
ncbi:MAG: hypothetical protein ACT4PZ_06125 [Panacagrimonas sp.]